MTQEKETKPMPGALMLIVEFAIIAATIWGIVTMVQMGDHQQEVSATLIVVTALLGLATFIVPGGFFTVEPGGSKVLILFGSYKGTTKKSGFYWTNPFVSKRPVSLRARTLNGER